MDDKELDKMAADLEPIEEPTKQVSVETPAGFVEDKETYVKPDGETTATPERTPTVIREESGAKKWMLGGLATILIVGLGASSAWLYTDAQNVRNELLSIKTGLDTAKADAAKLRDEVQSLKAKAVDEAPVEKTDKEVVTEVISATLHAPVANKNSKATVNVMKHGSEFAYVSAGFGEGSGAAYILKKVDGIWTVIFKGQDAVSDETVKEYGIPVEYRSSQ